MKVHVINDDAANHIVECDMIITDPPFDLCGHVLAGILEKQKCNHLVLITTMRQLIEFCKASEWKVAFDFVLDNVVPKHSKSIRQPNYTHSICVYMTRNKAKSLFNRKKRERSDTYDGSGYWPTILRAPRDRMKELGYAKNTRALVDIVGSFEVESIADLFAGSGTTGMVAFELDLDCVLIEKDKTLCEKMSKKFGFLKILKG